MKHLFLAILCAGLGHALAQHGVAKKPLPNWDDVKGLRKISFKYDTKISDEFRGKRLNEKRWDPHGLENGNTGCPKWNGPVDWVEPIYSTYHATTTDTNGKKISLRKRQYLIQGGKLKIRTSSKPASYFKSREYFCNKKTFRCNHNRKIPCYGTTYTGDPILKDPNDPKSYAYVIHDKCKREPFCIPHPKHVVGASRKYRKYVGVNLVGKRLFKYGYFEARVRLPDSPAVTAVWMHDDNMADGYSRWVREKDGFLRFESPSLIRSRRWQEIDFLEAMNSPRGDLWRQYIPNIHVFAGYKGEFTQRRVKKGRLGPIVLDQSVWTQPIPQFSPPDPGRNNEYHMNFGNTRTLARPWADAWHTVGLYWSPKEIRFVLDGRETLRLRNTLVHQPMFLTIGTGLNKQWAQQAPTNRQLGKWSQIDYVRRWTVKTKKGQEPPSKLPLLKIMPRNFQSLGKKYKAVDGVFPVKDDKKSIPDPAVRFFSGMLSGLSPGGESLFSNLAGGTANETAPAPAPAEQTGLSSEMDPTGAGESKGPSDSGQGPFGDMGFSNMGADFGVASGGEEEEEEDEMADPPLLPPGFWDNTENEQADLAELLPPGGIGNYLFPEQTGRKEQASPEELRAAETRQDRMRAADQEPVCDQSAGQTGLEDVNPETNLAGWATTYGDGRDAGVIPRGKCA